MSPTGKLLNIALIGCGKRAQEHLDAIDAASLFPMEVSVLHDVDSAAVRDLAKRVPGALAGTDLEMLIKSRPCHLAVICLPPGAKRDRLMDTLRAAEGLRAVLVEKPAGQDAAQVEETYRDLEIPVFVCHQLRLLPWIGDFKKWLENESPGHFKLSAVSYGKLMDQGLHMLDLSAWLLGGLPKNIDRIVAESEPARISAEKPLPVHWRMDTFHPGPLWTEVEASWGDDRKFVIRAGPIAAEDWLDKHLRFEFEDGWVQVNMTGITAGGNYEHLSVMGTLADYMSATQGVYEQLYQWMMEDGCEPDLPRLNEHIALLRWCDRVLHADRLRLQPPSYLSDCKYGSDRLSVVISLSDHRHMFGRCLDSWLRQECLPEDYQLILVGNRDTKWMEEKYRPLIRSHDIWLSTDRPIASRGHGEMIEYVVGVSASTDEWLFLTEPHCEVYPETVRQLRHAFATNEAAGFCVTSLDGVFKGWGKLEAMDYKIGFAEWRKAGHWMKMIMRGFAIRRTAYEAAGGLRIEYNRFCEWLIAADLHERGLYMAYEPGVELIHHYSLPPQELFEAVEEFNSGQMSYLDDLPEDAGENPYFARFGESVVLNNPEWETLRKEASRLAREKWGRRWRCQNVGAEFLPGQETRIRIRKIFHRIIVSFLLPFSKRAAYPFYLAFQEDCSALAQISYQREKQEFPVMKMGENWNAGRNTFDRLPGFYPSESYKGTELRWVKPLCGIPLDLPAGVKTTIRMEILPGILDWERLENAFLVFYGNPGHPEIISAEVLSGSLLNFHLPSTEDGGSKWAVFVFLEIKTASRERRNLSLPLTGIELISR